MAGDCVIGGHLIGTGKTVARLAVCPSLGYDGVRSRHWKGPYAMSLERHDGRLVPALCPAGIGRGTGTGTGTAGGTGDGLGTSSREQGDAGRGQFQPGM